MWCTYDDVRSHQCFVGGGRNRAGARGERDPAVDLGVVADVEVVLLHLDLEARVAHHLLASLDPVAAGVRLDLRDYHWRVDRRVEVDHDPVEAG